MTSKATLHIQNVKPEQLLTSQLMVTREVVGVTSDCGFGKTEALLHACSALAAKGYKSLVVSDPEPAKGTWATEHLKWSHLEHLKVAVLAGVPAPKRMQVLMQKADVYVINYHILKWMAANNMHEFHLVGADEANCLRGATSVWRECLLTLSKHARFCHFMTATPLSSSVAEYWGILRWADAGKTLGTTVTEFREKYMREHNHIWKVKNKAMEQEIRERIAHHFVEFRLDESAIVPIVEKTLSCRLRPESQAIYNDLRDKGVTVLTDPFRDKPLNKFQIVNKLSCLTSGFVYHELMEEITLAELKATNDPEALLESKTHRAAYDLFDDRRVLFMNALSAIEKKHGHGHILICYWFTHELEQLKELLPSGVSGKDFTDKQWNSGEIEYGFLQYNSSAKGRNLQGCGNVMIAYTQAWHFVQTYQIPRRMARQGQKAKEVYFYKLHIKGTLDDAKTQRIKERFSAHKALQLLTTREVDQF